jgi:hypothetical protein
MQAMHLLLRQYRLLHLQVHLLQAKEDLEFLQCPTEVNELFRSGARGTRPGKEVMPGSLGLDPVGVTFYAHPPEGALESHV